MSYYLIQDLELAKNEDEIINVIKNDFADYEVYFEAINKVKNNRQLDSRKILNEIIKQPVAFGILTEIIECSNHEDVIINAVQHEYADYNVYLKAIEKVKKNRQLDSRKILNEIIKKPDSGVILTEIIECSNYEDVIINAIQHEYADYLVKSLGAKKIQSLRSKNNNQIKENLDNKQNTDNKKQQNTAEVKNIENKKQPNNDEIKQQNNDEIKHTDNKEQQNDVDKLLKIRRNLEKLVEVKKEIKKKVVAQDDVVDSVLNAIFNNINILETNNDDLLRNKTNIFIDGPTGTGKTLILKEIADKLDIPIVIKQISSYSSSGYKGSNLDTILSDLLKEAGGDLNKAQRGIIVLDEFDKLAVNKDTNARLREEVQAELLTYISGGRININPDSRDEKLRSSIFDTSKVTFVALGAFTDLREKKIREAEASGVSKYEITVEDYQKEGLIKELVARFSLFTATHDLTVDKLKLILKTSSISPIYTLEKSLKDLYNVGISYSDDILNLIAEDAYYRKEGARSLFNIIKNIEDVCLTQIFSGQLDNIEITEDLYKKAMQKKIRSF